MKHLFLIQIFFAITVLHFSNTILAQSVTTYAIAASCTNGVPTNDAYLQISSITDGDRHSYSLGNTYSGPNYASATDITGVDGDWGLEV